MKTFTTNNGKKLLAALISAIATGGLFGINPAYALSPPNITTDISWGTKAGENGIGYVGVAHIMAAFNYARRQEEIQLGLTVNALGNLVLPSQSVWDGISDDAKALFLINAERTARAGMMLGVIGLPLAGIESHVDTVAKNYAQLLHDTDVMDHYEPSGDKNIDSPSIRLTSSLGASCKEFLTRSENLANFAAWSSGPVSAASIPLPVERAVYGWLYDDAGSNWGHREAVLLQDSPLSAPASLTSGFKNNHGASTHEGFLGIHRIGSTDYTPFGLKDGYNAYGVIVVMNIFDPVSDANAAACGYNVTLRTEDLPTTTPNNPPVAVDDNASTAYQTAVTISNALSNDTDANSHTLNITGNTNPSHGSVTRSGNSFVYTPANGFSGTDSFDYTVSDGNGGTDTGTITITVGAAPENRPPIAATDTAHTAYQTPVIINVLANDSDPDGDTFSIVGDIAPANGTIVQTGNDSFTYTPKANFSGADTFIYGINDAHGLHASGTVNITVAAPVITLDAVNDDIPPTNFNTPVEFNVVSNDTNPAGGARTIKTYTRPPSTAGTLTLTTTGTNLGKAKFTPKKGYSGTTSFTYTLRDSKGATDTATVTITVKPGVPPTPVADTANTKYGTPVTFNVLVNDGTPKPTITSNTTPAKGTIRVNKTSGDITYTPKKSTSGTDTFTYTVINAAGLTASANVTIEVATNNAPVAQYRAYDVPFGKARTLDKMALHTSDIDGDAILANSVVTQPTKGTVKISAGKFIYTPKRGALGEDFFTYTVKDIHGAVSNVGNIRINITTTPNTSS